MKPSLLIILLVFGGLAAFAMLRREPVCIDKPIPVPAPAQEAIAKKEPDPEPESEPEKPDANKNRFTGPHDGSHLRQGFNCPACAYKPLMY